MCGQVSNIVIAERDVCLATSAFSVILAQAGIQSRQRRDFNPAFPAGLDPGACPGSRIAVRDRPRSGVRRGDHANGDGVMGFSLSLQRCHEPL
jgi:hypothetical protein